MLKKLTLLVFVFCNFLSHTQAQQKYALIVGINKYYDKPGVPHRTQLGGCVNDAMSIKNMLLLQYGFKENHIRTLLDAQATRENLLAGFMDILTVAKKGDAVVFYYSGHGSWMSNKEQDSTDRKLKRGMNQAMVMSNLYAPNLDCLVRDAVLKKIGNKFVDKGVVVTMITDCCFSGIIVMPMLFMIHNPYHRVEYYSEPGGRNLPFNEIMDPLSIAAKEADSTWTEDSLKITLAPVIDEGAPDSRAFNLKDALVIHDSSYIIPPSKRPHSMFLGLAASNDIEPSLEEPDETNTRHGVYTKALLDAVKEHGPGITVAELVKSIKETFRRQMYFQSPQHHEDAARLGMNLIGIPPEGFSKNVAVPAVGILGKKVMLYAGAWSGISAGNLLVSGARNSKIMIRIDRAGNDESEATVVSGNAGSVNVGDLFSVTDHYTISAPLLKVFITGQNLTPQAFRDFMDKQVMPLTKLRHYMSYEDWYHNNPTWAVNYNDPGHDPNKLAGKIAARGGRDSFVVMLPIPEYYAAPIKAGMKKNQNVVLVKTPAEADYVLYLNYVRGNKPHYVFTWNHPMKDYNPIDSLMFINRSVKTRGPVLAPAEINNIILKLSGFANEFIRETGNHWLNFVPGRQ